MVQRASVRYSGELWEPILPPFLGGGGTTDSQMMVFPDIFDVNVAKVCLYFLIVPIL